MKDTSGEDARTGLRILPQRPGRSGLRPAAPDVVPLIGREAVESRLLKSLEGVLLGAGDCVVVQGPPGIGKSRVLAEAQARAARRGITVAAGRASELDRIAPLTTLLTALNECQPAIFTVGDLSGLRWREEDRSWLVDKLGAFLEEYSLTRPLLIVLDDMQWADELTALALRILVPALRTSPVLWLLARRPLPARSVAQQALNWLVADGAREIALPPLDEPELSALCVAMLGAAPDETLLRLMRGSGGNPFLLETLLTTLCESGQVKVVGGRATATDCTLPADFLTAVDQRLRSLPAAVRRLLDAGAVLGRPFTLDQAARVLGEEVVRLLEPAREAVESSMLVSIDSAFAFRHELVREAIYARRPGPEAAGHLARCQRERELAVVHEAVAEVASNAPGAAADLILSYLRMRPEPVPGQARLMADAVGLLAAAGRLAEASQLGESTLRRGLDGATGATVLLGLAEALKHAGQDQAAISYTGLALELANVPAAERARLLAVQAHAKLLTNDIPGADAAAAQAVELGQAVSQYSAVVFALEAQCASAYAHGALDHALGFAERAVRLADEAGSEAGRWRPRLWRGMVFTAMDRMDEAAEAFAADKRHTDQAGTAWSRPLGHLLHAGLLMATGKIADAEAEAEIGLRIARQFGAAGVTSSLLGVLAEIALRRGHPEAAEDYLRQFQWHVADGTGVLVEEITWKLAVYQDATGHPDLALATLAPLYEAFPSRLYLIVQEPSAGPRMVRMALAAGDRGLAAAAAAATRATARRNPGHASLAGAADQAEGLLGGSRELLLEAVSSFRASPRPYCRAFALEDAGTAEESSGNRGAAIRLLREAMDDHRQAGARRDAERVERGLRRLGVRAEPPVLRRAVKTGWASLTESELKVARLVAEGRTNRQIADHLILSPHTVDTHVRHAFAKLGVSSRVALTRLALADDEKRDAVLQIA